MLRHLGAPFFLAILAVVCTLLLLTGRETTAAAATTESSGSLGIIGKDGKLAGACPLKHTEVRGAISGFLARVTVTQVFENSAANTIEAVYTFPLPQDAAVDDMTIQVGDRTVKGVIKRREEAQAIYEKAKLTGHVAALLDQERPNIFTQSVANITRGAQVTVTISYVETLKYEEGSYEFVFPMVVGPRYIPGEMTGKKGGGWAPDTDQVPDASRITPPGTRAGHDISLELAIDAGVPLVDVHSNSHPIDMERTGVSAATVRLRDEATLPNKDFILKYDVAGEQISDAVLTTADKNGKGGYFTMVLQPPARVPESEITPKELVFVLDTSGSMWGFPLEKGKALVMQALDELYPGDTFNIITFSGDTHILFPEPAYPTAANIRKAKQLLASRTGGGGTEMMKAIRAALDPSDSQDHLRVVCFVTDGYVGNDMEIIGEVQKHTNARVFSFGIGSSVNRFLLDGMAKAGRGAVEYVSLEDKADDAAKRLYQRLRSPLLTDVSVDWGGLPVTEVYPQRVPDLFTGQPLVITGRYTSAMNGKVRLLGTRAGEKFEREIPVAFAADSSANGMLAGYWARTKIDDLMSLDWSGMQGGKPKPEVQKEITQLGLDYRLMTQFTSFVAVEERVVTKDGKPQRVEVPVEMPEGVNYDTVFGEDDKAPARLMSYGLTAQLSTSRRATAGYGAGVSGGIVSHKMAVAPPPPSSMPAVMVHADEDGEEQQEPAPKGERAVLESKLHSALLKAFDCTKTATGCPAQPGKMEIQIWLTDDSPAVLDQLKELGFEIKLHHTGQKMLEGRMVTGKLDTLTKLAAVKFVSPMHR